MQEQSRTQFVRVLVDVVYPLRIEGADPPYKAMDLVALVQEQLSQVGAILAGDAGDQRFGQKKSSRYGVVGDAGSISELFPA